MFVPGADVMQQVIFLPAQKPANQYSPVPHRVGEKEHPGGGSSSRNISGIHAAVSLSER